MTGDLMDTVGFVVSSKYRKQVIDRLADGPATPSRIADDVPMKMAHASRALSEFREHEIVELLVDEDRTKGRIYGLTGFGQEVHEQYQAVAPGGGGA